MVRRGVGILPSGDPRATTPLRSPVGADAVRPDTRVIRFVPDAGERERREAKVRPNLETCHGSYRVEPVFWTRLEPGSPFVTGAVDTVLGKAEVPLRV